MLRTLCEELIVSADEKTVSDEGKAPVKGDDGIESVDNGNVGIEKEGDTEDKDTNVKKMHEFNTDMEDRVKTLFIRISKSYGFLNGGQLSSDFVHDIRSKLHKCAKKLITHNKY